MANGARSSRKAKDDEDNDSKGSLSSGKKSVNSGAASAEASGVRRSPREILSKKNMTPSSSSGIRKSEHLEKQTTNFISMTPPAKRKSERVEQQKNPSPLRRSERGKMTSSSGSSGSKMSDKSPNLLDMKRKKEKKEKKAKQLIMQTIEINKFEQEDGQADKAPKKRMGARAYRALFRKRPKKVGGTDNCDDLRETDCGRREEEFLEELAERTCERTVVTTTSEFAKEALEKNSEHKLFPYGQMDSCEDMSSNEDGLQVSKNGLVAGEMNDDAEKAAQENLRNPRLVNSILHGGVLDCDISLEMVQKVMPSKKKGHDICIDSVASPILSSEDICTSTGAGTLLPSGCKRKYCNDSCGKSSKRQRFGCRSTKQEVFSCNTKLNQLFGSSDSKDRGKLDVGISTGHVEKPCNCMQQHISSADLDLQTGSDQSTCIVCQLDGELLCCHGKGCQRSYHLSCLEPPLEEFPLGLWYCLVCVRKKIESGVHSVSEGIEAIWDSRELGASEDGLRRQKQYFVKYKGLAHVHNRWVPENEVLLEAPLLVAKYNQKNQGAVWKQHWAVPHRMLQKRLLMTSKECDEHHNEGQDSDKLNCHVEWLVKWCGLGYEHASWELESATFFSCPEGQSLVRDYETRPMKAKRASKFDKDRAVASQKFSELPAGVLSGLDANLDAVNKLCTYWRRGQNAIIFDDQERIPNVISFVLSFPSDISRPFLIISTSTSLHSWDEELLHVAPSADVVVYSGSKELRNGIRNLEFYEGGCIMFQVLITSPEVISEDLTVLDCIGWEAIIVDECQCPRVASCFEQIKMFSASKRLLVVSSQLKDNMSEYLNLLSLLDSQSDSKGSDSLPMNSSENIGTLKERLAKYVAYECKSESSRFLEYWVPVLLSDVQLEQYCFTLLSNSLSLCSPSKNDPVGALRSILISSRKCCDHPYVVDYSLQMLLTKGLKEVEFLNAGVKASGKLQLLDAMLSEIKKRELKVLILFQYIGGSGRLMGDILDDFLRQRFGADSYERVDGGVIPSKKQSALNKFNNERERFVFLLETRACLPRIKLSAVGTVIIFGSDWSPMNDLRALQKITLDSQSEQIKVFRLYSSFTLEEKLLMLSKQDKTLNSNIENISPSSSHMLLKWGASYLFGQLDKFRGIPTLDASTLSEQLHLKDVIKEFFILLHQTGIDKDAIKLSLILQAKQNRGMYWTEMPLFGEQKIQVMNEDPPHIFWTKLLEGKSPTWKYSSCLSQRNRKRIQYLDDLQKKPEAKSVEVVKRCKKVVSDGNDHLSPKAGLQEGKIAAWDGEGRLGTSVYGLPPPLSRSTASGIDKIHATSSSLHLANNISKIPALNMVEWESRRKQRDTQKNLHVLLRPQIAKLCEFLHLSKEVKVMVERFLEYLMNNHLVNREPATILQAFQISLCWIAASLLKQKIDHKESLALAKQHLGFTCKKEEADYVYSMLRCLKRMFLYRIGLLKVPNSPKASSPTSKAIEGDYSNPTSYQLNVKGKIEDFSGFQEGSDMQAIAEYGVAPEFQLAQRDLLKSIKEIEKKCDKQMKKLIEKQREEVKQFNQKYEEEKAQLENKKRREAAVIRLLSNVSVMTDKLKNLDIEYAKKFDELKQQIDLHLKNLEALQVAAKGNVQERKTRWIEAVKFWARVELVKPPVNEANPSGGVSSVGFIQSASESGVRLSKIVHIAPDKVITYSDPIDMARPYKENSGVASVEDCNVTVCSGSGDEQAVCKDSCPEEQVSVRVIPDGGAQVDVPVNVSSGDVTESALCRRCSDEGQISDGSKLNMSNGDPETVFPAGAPETLVSMEAPSSEEIPNGATLSKPNRDTPFRESVTAISSEGGEKLVSYEAPSSVENSDGSNGQVPLREITNSSEGPEDLVSVEAPLSKEIVGGAALGKVVGDVHLRGTKTVSSAGCQYNLVSSKAPSSGEASDGITETVSSWEGHENLPSVVAPSSEEIPAGTTLNMADLEPPVSAPEAVSSSEGQGNIMSANSSFEKQIPAAATSNVPDVEVPKSTSEVATSSDGMDSIICTNPSSSKEQIPDTAALSIPAEVVFLTEPETASSEVLEGGSVHSENDGTSATEIDWWDGILRTMNLESEFQEASLADLSSVQPLSTSDQGGPLPPDLASLNVGYASSGIQAREIANNEMRNVSQVAETSPSNGTIDVTCNVSNPDAQRLRSAESTSNFSPPGLASVSAIEHQPSNEGQIANQISQASRQPVANHIEPSNQVVLQPVHSPIGGLVRQASEARTASVPSVSTGLPLQTAPAVSSRIPLPSYHDPLQIEMERIRKEKEQNIKVYEGTKLQLKSECEKEIEEVVAQIHRKYEVKLQEKEAEFLGQKKELYVNYNKVLLNKILAEAFMSICMDNRASASAVAQQGASSSFRQQRVQLSPQQMVQQPSPASGLPSTGSATRMQTLSRAVVNAQTMSPPLQPSTASGLPSTGPATSMQTVSPAVVNAQTRGPPLQVVNPSAFFSGTPTGPPHTNSLSPSTGNLQMGSEICAPAPHLQPFRPSTSFSPSSLPLQSHGMSSQQAHNNHPVASTSLLQSYGNPLAHRQASITGQSGRIRHEIAGGQAALPISPLPSLDVLMSMINLSGANANPQSNLLLDISSSLATLMQSNRSDEAQQSGATDIVCLSDDD